MLATGILAAALGMVMGVGDLLQAVDIRQVEVEGEIGRRLDVTVENNLLVIDLEKDFLAPFLKRDKPDGYIGIGKTIDALARFCAYTEDARLVERKKKLVDALLASQEADGYLGMFRPESRTVKLWDVHELSYLVLGLTSDYAFCGEEKSLAGARKLADYLIAELTAEPAKPVGDADLNPIMGTTGLDEAMLYLAGQSGDARYKKFVVENRRLAEWRKPLTLGRWGMIDGHAYAYMCKCLEQVRLSGDTPDTGLWDETRSVFDFLLDKDGMVVTGTCGDHECWHDTQSGITNLGETCATAYLVRFYDELLRKTAKPMFGDLMERSIFNALFAAQSPNGRKLRYYAPFEAPREYFDGDTYCCPCNYRRILPEIPAMIYYGRPDGVYVNLYAASEATVPFGEGEKVKIRQETDYPNSGHIALTVEDGSDKGWTLYLRKPRWARSATVRINGEDVVAEPAGEGLLKVTLAWKAADKVEVDFPMEWRLVKGRKAQSGRAVVMRGPQVFTYNPARNPELAGREPRLFTLDQDAPVEGPFPDDTVRPGGMSCRVRVWEPGAWYPHAKSREIVLTEFADPDATATYFVVSNPGSPLLVDDELMGTARTLFAK